MTEFSIGERMLLHLLKYRQVDTSEYFNIPWDLTQDGIASSLRISRAHASIELKKHREKGNVREEQVRIKGGKVKRKCYTLTDDGLAAAEKVKEEVIAAGIEPDSLLDLKRQDPEIVFESLSDKDRFALGCACVFRVPVPMADMPPHERSVIPFDVREYTAVPADFRKRFLEAFPEESRLWHIEAANYWGERGEDVLESPVDRVRERLYHQLAGGGTLEAAKNIDANLYDLMYEVDPELSEMVLAIDHDRMVTRKRDGIEYEEYKYARYRDSLLILKTELAVSLGRLDTAERLARELSDSPGQEEAGLALLAKVLMAKDKRDEADALIDKIMSSGNTVAALMAAETLVDMGDIDRAKKMSAEAGRNMVRNNEAAVMQKHFVDASIALAEGDTDAAVKKLDKVRDSTEGPARKKAEALKRRILFA